MDLGAVFRFRAHRRFIAHRLRPVHHEGDPVHVALRVKKGVPPLRGQLLERIVKLALLDQREKLDEAGAKHFRVVHFTIQADHLHLIVEAPNERGLARGVAGLEVRVGRRLNKVLRAPRLRLACPRLACPRLACPRPRLRRRRRLGVARARAWRSDDLTSKTTPEAPQTQTAASKTRSVRGPDIQILSSPKAHYFYDADVTSPKNFKASHAMLPRSVFVLLAVSDELRGPLTNELTSAGHVVVNWKPDEPVPPQAVVAIVEGLAGIEAATQAPCHLLAVLEPAERHRMLDLNRLASDFALKPLREGEVSARVTHLGVQPTWRERTMHRLFALAIERTSDVIEVTDPQARFQYVNPAYEKTLGVPRTEAIGKTPAQLVRSDYHPPEFWKALDATLSRGETFQGTFVSKSRSGRYVHFDTTITPIADKTGKFTHHVGVKRDITERLERAEAMVQANRALEKARDAALAASRAKSEFLANMSHELRTPLNAIIGYSEMAMEELDPESQMHEDMKVIRKAGGHLLTLIDDVLDISKIEADRVELVTENFPVIDLISSVEETIKPVAENNKNRIVTSIEDGISLVRADRTRLRQVLFNLVSNANKFTKAGTVSISARNIDKDGVRWVEFDITDTGIGISKEEQAKLFQPFVQADSSTTREYGGTGLGLVICKRLTEMMGGTIELQSEKGKGTTMRICLPPGDAKPDSEAPIRDDNGSNAPIVLVIDDEENDRELVARVLSKRGFRVEVASSGQTGIELAARLRPAAIVLDVNMPRMSGWDVLSALKLSEKTSSIPVVMLTVMHQEEIGRALGAVDYLIKPLQPKTLVEVLRRHVPSDSGRVLVVEDDEPTRELMTRTLRSAGHIVVEAENGKIALDRLEEANPQVIVLDLMMPVMDGMMFLHHLRAMDRYAKVPVIVATAQMLTEADREKLAATAQQVIEKKAHSRSELLSLIADEIRNRIGFDGAPESEITSE